MYTNGISTIAFFTVFGTWAISELVGPVRWGRSKQGQRRDKGSIIFGTISGLAGIICSLLLPLILPNATMPPALFFVGIALVFLGIGWRWYAILTLGRFFTATVMIQRDQTVIQHGPYKYSRHPSYAGVLLILVGLGCLIGNWGSMLLIVGGLFFPLLYRISIEEREMIDALGEEYKNYMSHTKWRLIPFVF